MWMGPPGNRRFSASARVEERSTRALISTYLLRMLLLRVHNTQFVLKILAIFPIVINSHNI
jgi:hypothetical protein